MDNYVSKDKIKECIIRKCEVLLSDNKEYAELRKSIAMACGDEDIISFFDNFNQLKNVIIITSCKMISSDIYNLLEID
jgi:hypothetical protein